MNRLSKNIAVKVLPLLAVLAVAACAQGEDPRAVEALPASAGISTPVQMDVFKQASCGCCGKWVEHMEKAGYGLSVTNSLDMNAIKNKYGVAPRYQSCHTAVAEGYIFEGHIPASIVEKFLAEKPSGALGLAVPGMPVGSPGMEMGGRFDEFDVLQLNRDGSSEVYAHITAAHR